MRLFFLRVLVIGSLVAGALSHRANYVVHKRRTVEPVAWVKTRRLEAHRNLTVRIGLTQQHVDELEEELMSVSHPESPKYGQHWTPLQVAQYFAPSEATMSTVKNWLIDAGFHPDRLHLSRGEGSISLRANVSVLESLLETEYHVYTSPSGHEQISPCGTALCYPRIL